MAAQRKAPATNHLFKVPTPQKPKPRTERYNLAKLQNPEAAITEHIAMHILIRNSCKFQRQAYKASVQQSEAILWARHFVTMKLATGSKSIRHFPCVVRHQSSQVAQREVCAGLVSNDPAAGHVRDYDTEHPGWGETSQVSLGYLKVWDSALTL